MTTKAKKKERFVPVPVPAPKKPAPKKPAPATPAPAAPVNAPPVPGPTAAAPSTPSSGFAPFAPTPTPHAGSGAADPNQPFGQGFGTDYGLDPTHDPNFAFGSGAASPGQTAQTGSSSGLGNGYARTADGTLIYTDPNGIQYVVDNGVFAQVSGYHQGTYNGLPPGNSALYPGAVGYVPPGTPQNQIPGYFQADAAGQYISGDWNAYTAYAQGRGVTPTAGPGSTPTVPSMSSQTIAPGTGSTAASTWGGLGNLGAPATAGGATGGATASASGGAGGGGGGGSAGGGVGSGGTQAQQDAQASIQQVLNNYGLGGLASWAWGEIVGGKSQDQVVLDLMQTPQFKQRFPGIDARRQAGLPPISPADYVNYEAQATQLMRAAGLPSGFWDSPADFTHLISADVSINELTQRLNLASQAAYQVPADVRATLTRDYGVGPGQLAAFFLDDKTALPLIQRDFTAAQIGGAAYRTGYGSTQGEDAQLTDLGVTPGQAQSGFTQLTMQRQLMSSLPGENTTGISRDQQLQATFGGNALDQEEIVRRSQQRAAVFNQGGQFGQTSTGFALGAAQGA